MYEKYATVLMQFRLPGEHQIPEGVTSHGEESYEAKQKRFAATDTMLPPQTLLERLGASPSSMVLLLCEAGFVLTEAHAHQRRSKTRGKPYVLLTFTYKKGAGLVPAPGSVRDAAAEHAQKRYEHVRIRESTDEKGLPIAMVVSNKIADAAAELEDLDDAEAKSYGIALSKAVPKGHRTNWREHMQKGPKVHNTALAGLANLLDK